MGSAKIPIAVLVSGNGSNLQALIDACVVADYPAYIAVVLSNIEEAYALERARKAGIATVCIHHRDYPLREAFDRALDATLQQYSIEYICLAGFMRILSPDFVHQWSNRMLNIHPSLLPKFKGLHTHKRVLLAGEHDHGCTVHLVTKALDDGEILAQSSLKIAADDTEESLRARVLTLEHQLYPTTLARFIRAKR